MKTIRTLSVFVLSAFLWAITSAQTLKNIPEKWIYAVEIDGILCGYAESQTTIIKENGREFINSDDEVIAKLSVLGGGVDMKIKHHILVDRETENPVLIERTVSTTAEIYASTRFEKGKAYFTNQRGGELREIELGADVILENTLSYPHLFKDFILNSETEKSYRVFDDMKGAVVIKNYKRIGKEELDLAGKKYQTTVVDEINQELGTTTRLWLCNENSFPLKIGILNRVIFLSDESIKKRIQTVNIDNSLFAKVDKVIYSVPDISFMKVEATIQSTGEWITPESLNFSGQKFEGTVTDNLIEGVFEIEKQHYDGKNAPAFPTRVTDENLKKYLVPESLIESDNMVLITEARKITEGSKDSWEAAVRLSKWVSENIHGAIPGGTSAINTYNTREGECGSHSRLLTAFCRAVGIPSRLSVGCMYTSIMGGSFGQHAWTEVYMGDAGWKPVDATANEIDFVDAGHIRLGENTSFNPKTMKILDYKMGNGVLNKSVPEEMQKYLGKYLHAEMNNTFEIRYKDGSLTVEIPGGQFLALNPPDEEGIFYPKMTRQINFSFENDLNGNIAQMKFQQVIPLGKKFEQDSVGADVPEEFKTIVGNYWLASAQATFKVIFENGTLAVHDPLSKKVVKLPEQNETGLWKDEFSKNEIEFVKNDKGEVIRMLIYSNIYMQKQTEL
ncbi:MAG: transglutaminase domain-containing protein [Bacteroidetes bacterium]|nr:MAG: transglutaminase domain-containing protein [Bacteroidota bacterium]